MLPVEHLSNSSIQTLRRCPEKWRRKYIEREYEPPNGKMVLGKTFGAAEAQSDHTWIESGEPISTDDVLDVFSDEWADLDEGEVDWQGEKPLVLRESGEIALRAYHAGVPSLPAPVEAERESRIAVVREDGTEIELLSYLDVEREDGSVEDRKLTGRKLSQARADGDPQATAYLTARRAEGNPASQFVFDTAVRVKKPYAERVPTERTDEQMDHFLLEVLGAADEIEWRTETDQWSYAPPDVWWCSEKSCGFWDSCPAGGLLRKRAAKALSVLEVAT